MYLIEIYLPVTTREGTDISKDTFGTVRNELTERFGGVTAFLRSPASGLWQDAEGKVQRDDIVIMEVITKSLDRRWWRAYRQALEKRFNQESVVLHACQIETI